MNAGGRIGAVHPDVIAHPARITPGEQACARGTANRGGRVIIGKAHTLLRHRINPRRFDLRRPITTEIVITLIINEDEDDVRLLRLGHRAEAKEQRANNGEDSFH